LLKKSPDFVTLFLRHRQTEQSSNHPGRCTGKAIKNQNMNRKTFTFFAFFLLSFYLSFSQERMTLSGTVTDAGSNETLIGATIYVPLTKTGTATNEYGFYSITLPKGDYKIEVSYVGFSTVETQIALNDDIKKDFSLTEAGQELEEVIITEKTKTLIRKPEMSVNKLSIETIKKMPVVLGEVDVLKSILLLPGVTNAGEGASGFNVRGGGADQNLILLD
jgi:hypothetical protein